jgi:hypothetical protein
MEAMAAESLVASAWELDGFLTKTRVPVTVPGGYSDVDVLGVDGAGTLRVAECKVPYEARRVIVADAEATASFVTWLGGWTKSVENIERLFATDETWVKSARAVDYWLCANIWFAPGSDPDAATAQLLSFVKKRVPAKLRDSTTVRVVSTRDLLLDVISRVRLRIEDGWGKRFGTPVLDAARELIHFCDPIPRGGGRGLHDTIRQQTRDELLKALGLDSAE